MKKVINKKSEIKIKICKTQEPLKLVVESNNKTITVRGPKIIIE